MALSLSILQPSGITASYWKVTRIHIDNINLTINAEVGGYIDQPTYASGAVPLTIMLETFGPAQFTTIMSSTSMITTFYTLLSQLPDFMGSTVVS